MQSIITQWQRTVGIVAGIAGIAASARGQNMIQTNPNVVVFSGQPVPGLPGVIISTASSMDSAAMDDSGNVIFRTRISGTGVTALNERAILRGSNYGNLSVLVRSGDPAPGIAGVTLNTATGTGVGSAPREASNGRTFWGSALAGTGVTTANDSALFGGFAGNQILIAREGDPAPGTVGASFSGSIGNLSYQPTGAIQNGRVLFQSATVGGDTTTANNAAWFSGSAGALELVMRKGDAAPGGTVIGALSSVSQINDAGQVLIDALLSTTLGSTPATTASDATLWIWTPGGGIQLIAREGDPAPGTVGATLNNFTPSQFFMNVPTTAFNNAGQGVLQLDLQNGDVTPGLNDRGLYLATTSGLTMLIRRGDPAPGTDGGFNVINHATMQFVNFGQIAFEGQITGGTQTTANDSGIWIGTPGNLQLVMREGDLAPGTPGCMFNDVIGQTLLMNEKGQLLFMTKVFGGDAVPFVNDIACYAWDPILGLMQVGRVQDQFEIAPGDIRTLGSIGHVQFNGGDGNPLSFNRNGQFAVRVSFTVPANGSNGAIITMQIPRCDTDTDGDASPDCIDNCDTVMNAGQLDTDGDLVGDACDNCTSISNPGQADCDNDAIGDACEIAAGDPDCNLNGIPDVCDIANATSLDANTNGTPDECEGGVGFCYGDTGCPCGNDSQPGDNQGCMNTSGFGATLSGTGLTKLSSDTLELQANGMVAGFCYFFQGDVQGTGPFAGTDGLSCAGGNLIRLGTKSVAGGSAAYGPGQLDPQVSAMGQVLAPGTRYYQVLYRNSGGPCDTGSNTTHGVQVNWVL